MRWPLALAVAAAAIAALVVVSMSSRDDDAYSPPFTLTHFASAGVLTADGEVDAARLRPEVDAVCVAEYPDLLTIEKTDTRDYKVILRVSAGDKDDERGYSTQSNVFVGTNIDELGALGHDVELKSIDPNGRTGSVSARLVDEDGTAADVSMSWKCETDAGPSDGIELPEE